MRPTSSLAVSFQLEDKVNQIRRINNDLSLPEVKEVQRTSLLNRKKKLLREAARLAQMCGRDIKSLFV